MLYNRRKLSSLRHKNCFAILAGIAKDYSISGYNIIDARTWGMTGIWPFSYEFEVLADVR